MENRQTKSPIFIVGHSRSGSTLLASLLGRHPNIHAIPETHFFNGSYSGFFLRRLWAQKSINKILSYTVERNVRLRDIGVTQKEIKEFSNNEHLASVKSVFNSIMGIELQRSGKQRILEKTPYHIEHIDRVFRWYPGAKVICTIRDSRDTIDSLVKAPWTHSNPQRHAAYWSWCVREALNKQRKYPAGMLICKYEDLVTEPVQELKRITDFIDEKFVPTLISGSPISQVIPSWEKSWKEKAEQEIDGSYAYKWKKATKKRHEDWSIWTRGGLKDMHYPNPYSGKKRVSFIYYQPTFNFLYRFWVVFRTHFAERKNKYRRKSLK
ncbi:sulfotransferase [Marinobacter sp.]|uniref:sulfotransferase family protein n=1 Tax=Marinobacter sp. TaxID=50741 RepID=UPI002B27B137|nr:sulfotransferase [Marinobacter sp.]